MTIKNLDRIRKELSPARRMRITARAATLITEEKSLQELRHKLTQNEDGLAILEERSDSTAARRRRS